MLHIYRHILYVYIAYCSLDDNVGIYKMIFIFIKLENDNSNDTNARAVAISRLLPRLLRPQADQFPPASVSRICSVTAIKTVLWHCPDYIAMPGSRRYWMGGGGSTRGYQGVPGSSCGCCVGVVLCPVSEQLLNALKFIHRAQRTPQAQSEYIYRCLNE